jgi:hypothetical protein
MTPGNGGMGIMLTGFSCPTTYRTSRLHCRVRYHKFSRKSRRWKELADGAVILGSFGCLSMRCTIPSPDHVGPETPLRLNVAVALAFPDGSMTASGLRRRQRGVGA